MKMKKSFLALIAVSAIIIITGLCFVGCEKEEKELPTPSGFRAYQDEQTIVLTWNEVNGASFYEINKNGSYWQSTSETQVIDRNPVEGINTYELTASNGNKQSKPVKTSCDFESEDDNPSGGGGGQTTANYYIKHPWGDGSDASWSWKPMTKSGSNYTYTGLWGGIGANINTSADDSGSEWYAASSISGASSLSVGDKVTFTFVSSSGAKGTLSVTSNGGGSNPGGGGTTSKPNTPSNVKATASSSYITVTWNSVSGADNYNVYRSTSSSGTYSFLSTAYSATYKDYDVNAGTTYYYKVTAENSAGESGQSAYASAKISSGGGGGGTTNYEPCPPSVTCSGTSSITVKWTPSTGTGCGTPTSYDVKRMNRITGTAETLKSGTTSTSYTDSQPFPGVNMYGVTASNSYGSGMGQNMSSAVGIAAPTFYDGMNANSHEVYIDIKGLNVPNDWKPYYTLELYWGTSSSGYFTLQGSWKYYDYKLDLGNNNFCYVYDFGNSVDFSGKTYYYKLRWVFEAPHSPSRVEGSYTAVKSVTHKK